MENIDKYLNGPMLDEKCFDKKLSKEQLQAYLKALNRVHEECETKKEFTHTCRNCDSTFKYRDEQRDFIHIFEECIVRQSSCKYCGHPIINIELSTKYKNIMIELFKKHRKNRLKDSDVREIAKMQMRIDYYEQSFLKLWQLTQGKDPGFTLLRDDDIDFPVIDLLYKSISTLTSKKRKSMAKKYEMILLEWASRIESGFKADIEQYCKESLYRDSIMKIDRFIDKNTEK